MKVVSQVIFSILISSVPGPLFGLEPPIVLGPPCVLDVFSKVDAPSNIRYVGQSAVEKKIDLTATNGFFDRCFEALDPQPILPGDEGFINVSYGYLGRLSDQVPGTARWHLWCAEAGQIKATFFLQVPAGETNHPWLIRVGYEEQMLRVNESVGEAPQQQSLTFTVRQPGKVSFTIDCTKNPPPAQTRICFIRLEGSAVEKASLLRTRWRPAAVHARYCAPANCPTPKLWVFETRAVAKVASYSPITTPFGYFGTGFDGNGRVPAGAGFNFSMWIANRNATAAPPIEQMSRLIGTDLSAARYDHFGHEGSGIKFRDAVAYKTGADRVIQALRAEIKDGLWTFYGYFYDEPEQRWKLFASAQQTLKGGEKAIKAYLESGTLRSTGSFCEIPGPPNRERSGDVVREMKRRGWFYGNDRAWYRAQMSDESAQANPQTTNPLGPDSLTGKRTCYAADFAAEGWMSMATGGMECYVANAHDRTPPQPADSSPSLPEYLVPNKAAQLFELPVEFGESQSIRVAADRATIECDILKTGPNSKAVLYYGTVDCVTYPPQKVSRGSAVEIDMYRPERTWQSATPERSVAAGKNQFELSGLQAGTTYYYRLFVTHDQGKSWDYQSGRFQTK